MSQYMLLSFGIHINISSCSSCSLFLTARVRRNLRMSKRLQIYVREESCWSWIEKQAWTNCYCRRKELLTWMIRKMLIWSTIACGHHSKGKMMTEIKLSLGVAFANTNIFDIAQICMNWNVNLWVVLKTWLPRGSFSGRRHDDTAIISRLRKKLSKVTIRL